ncbi:hypothetical protein [Micromonospora sp. CA-244673]|uniref:hypothetical protein n=1 Tax=Micromonospora sp. CA-244673 TaxID=3239958 RepID=UPI003D8C1376
MSCPADKAQSARPGRRLGRPRRRYGGQPDRTTSQIGALAQIEQVAIARAEQADQAQLPADRATREAEQRTARTMALREQALVDRAIESAKAAVADRKGARREADAAVTRALAAENARSHAQAVAEERARALVTEEQRRAPLPSSRPPNWATRSPSSPRSRPRPAASKPASTPSTTNT